LGPTHTNRSRVNTLPNRRRTAPGAYGVASLISVIALHGVSVRIVGGTPTKQDPRLKVCVLLSIGGNPAFSRHLIGASFRQFMSIDRSKVSNLTIAAA